MRKKDKVFENKSDIINLIHIHICKFCYQIEQKCQNNTTAVTIQTNEFQKVWRIKKNERNKEREREKM